MEESMIINVFLPSGGVVQCGVNKTTTVGDLKEKLGKHVSEGGKELYFMRPDQYERSLRDHELPYKIQRHYMHCMGYADSTLAECSRRDFSYAFKFRLGDWSAETGESAIPLTENGLILHRQGSKFFKRWRLVYCAIVNGELRLSTGPTSTPYVHLKLFGCHIEAQSKKRFGFTITKDVGLPSEKVLYLASRTETESSDWLRKMLVAVRVDSSELHLDDRKIRTIKQNIDKSVGLLNLSRNHVKLDKAQCNALSHVHTLILDVNHLKEFPAELACMSSLEVLNVSDNRLTQVPESLLQVTNLTSLVMSMNNLSTLPREFQRLVNLRVLNVSFNKFTEIPECVYQLSRLEQLSIAGNELKVLPKDIGRLTNLFKLYIQRNFLTELPDQLNTLRELQMLNASYNYITKMPKLDMAGLEFVCLNQNPLEEVWCESENLYLFQLSDTLVQSLYMGVNTANLVHVVLARNKLTELSDAAFNAMANVESLIVDHNELTCLPKRTFESNSLQFFSACWNKIEALPTQVSNPNLVDIRLQNNRIKVLPPAFDQFHQLRTLQMSGNPLEAVPGFCNSNANVMEEVSLSHCQLDDSVWACILTMTRLRILDLSYNRSITELPPALGARCPNLEIINLVGNDLHDITPIRSINGVKQLFLGRNFVTQIPSPMFLPSLFHLDMSYNKLATCDLTLTTTLRVLELQGNDNLQPNTQKKLEALAVCWTSGESSMQGRRPTMEDAHLLLNSFTDSGDGLFAVFDGHAGDDAALVMAHVFADEFLKALADPPTGCSCGCVCEKGCYKSVMFSAFREANHIVGGKKFDKGGATSVVLYITPPIQAQSAGEPAGCKCTEATPDADVCEGTHHRNTVGINTATHTIDIATDNTIPNEDTSMAGARTPEGVNSDDITSVAMVTEGSDGIEINAESVGFAVDTVVQTANVPTEGLSNGAPSGSENGERYMVIGNVGDAEAAMCMSDGTAVELTVKHSICRKEEETRIRSHAGGYITDAGRVVGVLATCRAVGDFRLYPYVSCVPSVRKVKLTQDVKFVILACDGLFDVMSLQEAVDLIIDFTDPAMAAAYLRNYAFAMGSADNISVQVILFNHT